MDLPGPGLPLDHHARLPQRSADRDRRVSRILANSSGCRLRRHVLLLRLLLRGIEWRAVGGVVHTVLRGHVPRERNAQHRVDDEDWRGFIRLWVPTCVHLLARLPCCHGQSRCVLQVFPRDLFTQREKRHARRSQSADLLPTPC